MTEPIVNTAIRSTTGASFTPLGIEPKVQNVKIPDNDGILTRLETLTIDKRIPEFLRDNKRLFKFKAIMKLAKSNLN